MEGIPKDRRFAHIANDPRFKTIPRAQRKVKIDKRFHGMFKDKKFKLKYSVDKRGRPAAGTSNEDLERFYAISSDDSSDSEVDDSKPHKITKRGLLARSESSPSGKSSNFEDDKRNEVRIDDELPTEKLKLKLRDLSVDYARGEGEIVSSSSSDEESSEDDEKNTIEHEWGELDKEAERTDEITRRLAVCNMDWDRIKAADLMILFSSFSPPGGLVHSVKIYPSQFGLERMKKEEEEGPQELVRNKSRLHKEAVEETTESNESEESENDLGDVDNNPLDENEEGRNYQMENLRKYQLNRLKYFYAIVECDSSSTANQIYNECDGMEYESSATRLDLRFVPDDTIFEEEPRETCLEMPDTSKYRPRSFTTTALQQGKVELTWDETDPTRAEFTERLMAGDKIDDGDLKAYLASSSDDDENSGKLLSNASSKQSDDKNVLNGPTTNLGESVSDSDEDDSITKYRSLLTGLENEEHEKKTGDVHMEISWDLGLKEKAEDAVKKHFSSLKQLTPFQEMVEKLKEKRKEKKKMKRMATTECENDNLSNDDEIPPDVDMNDPFFAQLKNEHSSNKSSQQSKEEHINDNDSLKKAELELLLLDESSSRHFNFKKIQKDSIEKHANRRKKGGKKTSASQADNDDFMVNVNDSRFSSLYSSHHFNIDPSDPHFKKSAGMDALISVKQKRLAQQSDDGAVKGRELAPPKHLKKDPELTALIKSVKHKTKNMRK